MSWDNILAGNYGWIGKLEVIENGVPQDISSYTTRKFVFVNPAGVVSIKDAVFDTDGTDGMLKYQVVQGDIDTPGIWKIYARLIKTGAQVTSHPPLRIEVGESPD